MRAMRAETFSGYEGLKLIELPKPAVTDGKVLVRMTAAGVTPLDHTILSGKFHGSKAPLVLGNEGAGVVDGADIVIDGIGGEVLSEALGALALEGRVTTLGYSASRKTTIDVTNLIVPQASIRGLNIFAQPKAAVTKAWNGIVSLLKSGAIKPIVAKTF